MTLTPELDNVLAVYACALPDAREMGFNWYPYAHDLALSLDSDIEQSAGVIAVLSPQVNWDRNMQLAVKAYENGHLDGGCLGKNVAKANRILAGERAANVIGGDKVTNFWRTIIDPDNTEFQAVIDRHAFDIAVGQRCKDSDRKLGKKRYAEFANVYEVAAKWTNIKIQQMQAITWCAWKDANGILV